MARKTEKKQPDPLTGRRTPDWSDPTLSANVDKARTAMEGIWIDHEPQLAIIAQLREYIAETCGKLGRPISGRRLSQKSQAGKSALAWHLKHQLETEGKAQGLAVNPYQLIIVTIEKGMTLKGFMQALLKQMGDDFLDSHDDGRKTVDDRRTIPVLEKRIAEWVPKLGVELVVADEVQRLKGALGESNRVTERFQTMLDRGIAPLLLIGNGESVDFFSSNPDLCARLGMPLELAPLDPERREPARLFQKFCREYDLMLRNRGVFGIPSDLGERPIIDGLALVSGGHVGRAARVIQEAVPLAVRRGALKIEPFDLSCVTQGYAMANGWIDEDPFSS
ncbi:AAA family ATPase [Aurantiacibacter spongiae]|uniref:ORC1/DEAH AAA+ ATPase domain-containing protein n=1 Tax=Aurantiacibacter spongiae TaxID=2488860 RepID=A0A3N5DHF2_9SPHN|nr:AAA family ATPase [Aurantiacibacter spongiae]RPF71092.1 hypothetical protein EG799_05295 [Aurantiacibacter spongiae]